MQDHFSHLLHLGDLAFPEDEHRHDLDAIACTGAYLLSEEDRISLSQLAPSQVQEWCQSRTVKYQSYNRLLLQSYGAAARNAISKNKSHIRALRSAYNDAAPIHQYLPPEMLMEIFSHVHPAVIPRPRIPVLRVCRYWRQVLLRTPRFWANLLSFPTWKAWNPKHHMGRFRAALARSAPESLALSVPFPTQVIVDILTPHANRLSAFRVGPTLYSVEELAQVLEQHMPHLTHLAILHQCWWYSKTSTFDLKFGHYPNIQSIELERVHFYTPTVPYPSLRYLKLMYCTVRPSPTAISGVPALRAMHDALEFFPNLVTLSMSRSLMDDGPPRGSVQPPCELTKSVSLPRLRHLEIADMLDHIPRFLAHLIFPTTAALVLQPAFTINYSRLPPPIPVHPGFNGPTPCPNAELSLYLDFRPSRRDEQLARWETHGAGVRPVRVTLTGVASHTPTVSRFTRELAEALAPAPARGVTSLTVEGLCLSRNPYWEHLLCELPGLRRFACGRVWTTKAVVGTLGGKRSPGGEYLCARLEDLDLAWCLPDSVIEPGREEEWHLLQHDSRGGQLLDVKPEPQLQPKSPLATLLRKFCDTLGACLSARAGRCAPIRKLSVSLHWGTYRRDSAFLEEWQVALVERHLRYALDHLVESVVFSSEVKSS